MQRDLLAYSINQNVHFTMNQDIMNDLNNLAGNAYQYCILPSSIGGIPDGTNKGYMILPSLASTKNVGYNLSVESNSVVFTATALGGQGAISATVDRTGALSNLIYSGKYK
ncbi:MAG: hypothetical protein ACP5US_11870 [Candidatus Kryptoniota bacterium]